MAEKLKNKKPKNTFAGFLPNNPLFMDPSRKESRLALTATLMPPSLSFSFSPLHLRLPAFGFCFAAAREFQTFLAGIGQRHADELFPRAIHHTGVAIQKRNQTD